MDPAKHPYVALLNPSYLEDQSDDSDYSDDTSDTSSSSDEETPFGSGDKQLLAKARAKAAKDAAVAAEAAKAAAPSSTATKAVVPTLTATKAVAAMSAPTAMKTSSATSKAASSSAAKRDADKDESSDEEDGGDAGNKAVTDREMCAFSFSVLFALTPLLLKTENDTHGLTTYHFVKTSAQVPDYAKTRSSKNYPRLR